VGDEAALGGIAALGYDLPGFSFLLPCIAGLCSFDW
jgi:hypothetical protein